MRQKALRASRTCVSHKGYLEAVRHSPCSRSSKKTRASGTDGHHLIHRKIPLPRPLPFTTNRRALFSWSRWDGRLWETTALWAYHKSQFVHIAKREQDSLRSAQTQLLERPMSGEHFWHTHYTDVHIANQSMHDFYLLIHETTAIKFILKTSPMKIQKRMYHTIAALDSGSFQVWLHVNQLHTLRTIWTHRTNNPLHFKAAVDRERRTAVARHMLEKHQTFEKSVRKDRKLTFGQDWLLHSKVRYPLPKDHFEPNKASFVVACDACPQRWTTEPLLHIIDLICGRLNSCSKFIEDFPNADRQTLSISALKQGQILLRTMSVCSWDLSLLAQEFVALRYYRLHHFPSSFQDKEIQLWKQFWLHTFTLAYVQATDGKDCKAQSPVVKTGKTYRTWLPETYKARLIREESRDVPSKGMQDKTMLSHKEDGLDKDSSLRTLEISRPARHLSNSLGQISWIRWDGQELKIGSTIAYKDNSIVLGATHARARLEEIQRHAPEHMPYDIDIVRMSHYRSLWHVNLRLRPFLELVVSLSAITFLVRTAPAGIRDRLIRHVQVIELLDYDVGLDLEILRKLQSMLALLPQSPLLFLDYAKNFKTTSASRQLLGQWLTATKSHRLNAKVVSGPAGVLNSKDFRSKKEDHARRAQLVLKNRSVESWTWRSERPFAIVAPFRSTAYRMMGDILSTLRHSHRHMKEPYIRISRWTRPLLTIRRAFACTRQMLFLIDDLAVLRYYRIQHYPESVSETALRLEQAFADANATNKPSPKLKVPKPSQKSIRGKAKHPIGQAFGNQRTSKESRSSETRSNPQTFLAGKGAKPRTRIAPSHGVDEKNHQLHQHRVPKISQNGRPHASEKDKTDIKPVLSMTEKSVPRLKHQR